jgi:predicted CXXCH cytochrome family protein
MNQQVNEPYQCLPTVAPVSKLKHGFSSAANDKRFIRFILASLIVLTSFCFASAQKKDSCIDCHSRLEGKLAEPVQQFNDNIHKARGLSCNDCHGGDPTQDDKRAAKDPMKGYIGKPKPSDIPAFCGKCHSDADLMKRFNPSLRVDQEREYSTSIHGQRLKTGDQKVATCVSCHGVHNIRAITDPLSSVYASNVADTCAKCHANADYMKGYNIPTDQFAKYRTSVHAKALYEKQDLSAPTCNDCHGNHGAAPPGLASVANVCGQCHVRQAELFQASPHKAKFDQMQVGECIRCHNNHDILPPSDQMIGTTEKSVCTSCHTPGDKGFVAAGRIRAKLDELSDGINRATEILNQAERKGMEVSRPKFELREAVDGLTHARVLIHTSSPEEVEKVTGPGFAVSQKGYQAGVAALAELSYRRKGLVVSLVFILFLATLVFLKVREIESRQPA